jgi:hypothetical protein
VSEFSREESDSAREIFEGRVDGKTACHFCAGIHATVAGLMPTRQPCPRVKRLEWHVDGTVLVLEYWPPSEWADENTIFPHDVYDEEETP